MSESNVPVFKKVELIKYFVHLDPVDIVDVVF